jgi:hypothetical protein
MKTVDEIRAYLEQVLAEIYERSYLYGPTLIEIESWLFIIHSIWAELTERRDELEKWKTQLTPIGCRSATGSFCRVFDVIHPTKGEAEKKAYMLKSWMQPNLVSTFRPALQ